MLARSSSNYLSTGLRSTERRNTTTASWWEVGLQLHPAFRLQLCPNPAELSKNTTSVCISTAGELPARRHPACLGQSTQVVICSEIQGLEALWPKATAVMPS